MLSVLPTADLATCCPLPLVRTALPFLNTQVAVLSAQGVPVLLAVPGSSVGRSHLLVIPISGGDPTAIPVQADGACVVAGPDGLAYLGTHAGQLLRYDPATGGMEELSGALDEECFLTGFASATGKIFFGSSPGGIIVEYDPASATGAHYFHWRSDHQHPQHAAAFVDLPDGRVAAFLNGSTHATLIIAPDAHAWERGEVGGLAGECGVQQVIALDEESLLLSTLPGRRLFKLSAQTLQVIAPVPSLPDDDMIFALQRIGDTVMASGTSGALYHYSATGWERLGTPIPYDPLLFAALPDGRLAGLTYLGRLLQSSSDFRMYTISALPTLSTGMLAIQAMGMSPDRKLYFSFAQNMQLGYWDPDEDEFGKPFVAAPYPGDVSALGFAGERLLIGFSPACGVMAYYPELPYRLQENPRLLGIADSEQRRPIGPMVHHESNVYFAAAAVSPQCDGAIVRISPLDNDITIIPHILPGQNITSLVADRLSGLLVAGGSQQTDRPGAPAVAPALAFWSPYQGETIRQIVPFPAATTLRVWAAEGGRIYVTDGGTGLAILSSEGEILTTEEFPLGVITALITNREGKLYGLAGGYFFHLDAETNQVECLAHAQGTQLTEVRRDLFAFADGGTIMTLRFW